MLGSHWSLFPGHSKPARYPPCTASRSTLKCCHHKPAICKAGASGRERTCLRKMRPKRPLDSGGVLPHSSILPRRATVLCKYCPVARTFKAAVPADEEEADFILVSIGQGWRGTNRGRRGLGFTLNHCCEGKHYGGNVLFRLSPRREGKLSLSRSKYQEPPPPLGLVFPDVP